MKSNLFTWRNCIPVGIHLSLIRGSDQESANHSARFVEWKSRFVATTVDILLVSGFHRKNSFLVSLNWFIFYIMINLRILDMSSICFNFLFGRTEREWRSMENKIWMQLAFFYEHQNIISNINIFKLSVYANISENDSKLIIFGNLEIGVPL